MRAPHSKVPLPVEGQLSNNETAMRTLHSDIVPAKELMINSSVKRQPRVLLPDQNRHPAQPHNKENKKLHYTKSQLSAWKAADISSKTKEMINPILIKCNNKIKKLGIAMCKLQTKQIRLITQILSWKNRLNYHNMFNIGYTYSKECDKVVMKEKGNSGKFYVNAQHSQHYPH